MQVGRTFVWLAALVAVSVWVASGVSAQSNPPLVPGGEGFGMNTRAAYGCGANPTIVRVTNLNDSGPGSLREALDSGDPRVVIFEISGTITLHTDIDITTPCLTIAGQTAPSPGITIRNGGLNLYAYNVLIQHIRIRPGDGGVRQPQTWGHDATISYGAYGHTPYNIIYDHVSFSWAGGKNVIIGTNRDPANVTFWRCIISEALYYARNVIVDPGQPSSLGMLIGENGGVSLLGNLFAHNSDRNPEIHEKAEVQMVNNVIYDWGKDTTAYPWGTFFYAPVPGPWKATIVGNKYIAGPPPSPYTPLIAIGVWTGDSASRVYMSDNAIDDTHQQVLPFYNYAGFNPVTNTPPVPLTGITVRPSSAVEAYVLGNAGARPADRDAVDTRVVNQVANRTGGVISSQDEVGGWPSLAVNTRHLTVPSSPHAMTAAGYTNLEVWLHGFAAAVEGSGGGQTLVAPSGLRLSQTY